LASRHLPNAVAVTAALAVLTGGAAASGILMSRGAHPHSAARQAAAHSAHRPARGDPPSTAAPATSAPTTSTTAVTPSTVPPTTAPVGPGEHGPITSPPLPAPGPGFVEGQVTALGDSVMIDYEQPLSQDIPGIHITAQVSRWWTQGESILASLKAESALGGVVIVGLATNGPISSAQFDSMMRVLTGASRVVFVNTHVDQSWQGPNNTVLSEGVASYPRAVLADWYTLAQENPGWLYSTQTHLPVDGSGAQALAALVAQAA